jgi:hypothetical protein
MIIIVSVGAFIAGYLLRGVIAVMWERKRLRLEAKLRIEAERKARLTRHGIPAWFFEEGPGRRFHARESYPCAQATETEEGSGQWFKDPASYGLTSDGKPINGDGK